LRPRSGVVVCLVVLAVVLLRYHPFLTATGTVLGHDWYHMHQVDGTYAQRAAAEGDLVPLWQPWVLGGTPLYSVPSKAFGYPPWMLANAWLGPVLGMNLLLLLHLAWGGFGAARAAARFGLSGAAPVLAGVLFVLSVFPAHGFRASPFSFGFAMAWWPWLMVSWVDLLEGRRSTRAGVSLGVISALALHAGGEAPLLWFACFALAFSVPYWKGLATPRALARFGAGAAVAVLLFCGLAAVKLLPMATWLAESGRGQPLGVEFARDSAVVGHHERMGHATPTLSFAVVVARLYLAEGALVLLAGLALGLRSGWRRRAWIGLLLGTAITFLLAAGSFHEWAYDWLPGYDRMRRHSRFVHVTGLGLVWLAAFGLQGRGLTPRWAWGGLLAVLLVADHAVRPALEGLKSPADRLRLVQPFLQPALDDPGLFRIHHAGDREQPIWIELGLESTSGALGGPRSGNATYATLLPERANPRQLERTARGVLDVLGVRYVASYVSLEGEHLEAAIRPREEPGPDRALYEEFAIEPFTLYRRSTARPRAMLVSAPTWLVGEPDERLAALRQLMRPARFDAARETYVERAADVELGELLETGPVFLAGASLAGARAAIAHANDLEPSRSAEFVLSSEPDGVRIQAPARLTSLEPLDDARVDKRMTRVEVDVSDRSADGLLLAELFTLYFGWSAEVDGTPVSMRRADGLATFVPLPRGARTVRFVYRPPGLVSGAWVTALTGFLALALIVREARRPSGDR